MNYQVNLCNFIDTDMKENLIVLFLGPSGCGKDTQSELLVKDYNFQNISTGNLLREEIREDTKDGKVLKDMVDNGLWPPNDLMYRVFIKRMSEMDLKKRLILQGFIREKNQPLLFEKLLSELNLKLDLAVHFDLSLDEAVVRLSYRRICPKCNEIYHLKYKPPKRDGICDKDGEELFQRNDDYPEAIEKRLAQYNKDIEFLINLYDRRGILKHVDGSKSIPDVYKQLLVILEKL